MTSLDYLYIFLQTVLLKLPIVFYYYGRSVKVPWYKPLLVTGFAHCLTHPVVFFGVMALGLPYLLGMLFSQLFVMLVDVYVHRSVGHLPWGQSIHASVLSNILAWQLSVVLTYWIYFRPNF